MCSDSHVTALHRQRENVVKREEPDVQVNYVCEQKGRFSFSKTVLVEITMADVVAKSIIAYCIVDECSNSTLVDESVVEYFGRRFPIQEFSIGFADQTCIKTNGYVVQGLRVRGVRESECIEIPEALSQPVIADTRAEVATPNIVAQFPHSARYAHNFPPKENARVLLLIGRNCGRALSTRCLTPNQEPYVHQTPLGFALVGQCGNIRDKRYQVCRTEVDSLIPTSISPDFSVKPKEMRFDIYERKEDDDTQGFSQDDKTFLSLMCSNVILTSEGNLQLPLPLKNVTLPDNRLAVKVRTSKTLERLRSNSHKLEKCLDSMRHLIENNYVERVSSPVVVGKSWYLPVFCVTTERKPKPRLVFDAAAK